MVISLSFGAQCHQRGVIGSASEGRAVLFRMVTATEANQGVRWSRAWPHDGFPFCLDALCILSSLPFTTNSVFLLMAVLRKEPYYTFTLKGCVLGRQNKASMGHAVLLDLLHDPRIITVTTTLSMDGGNEPSQR